MYLPCEEQRMHQVESLLSEVPLVLDEDDDRERDRDQKLLEIRGKLASWFLEIRHDNNMREVLFTFLSKLKEMHGQDMVFAPLPECETQPEPKADALVRKASSVSSLSTESSSGSSVVSHKLFYLCHEGTVWTVIQAGCVLKDICSFPVISQMIPLKRTQVVAVNTQTFEPTSRFVFKHSLSGGTALRWVQVLPEYERMVHSENTLFSVVLEKLGVNGTRSC